VKAAPRLCLVAGIFGHVPYGVGWRDLPRRYKLPAFKGAARCCRGRRTGPAPYWPHAVLAPYRFHHFNLGDSNSAFRSQVAAVEILAVVFLA